MIDDDNKPNGRESEDYGYEKYRQERVDAGTWRTPDPDDEILKQLEEAPA